MLNNVLVYLRCISEADTFKIKINGDSMYPLLKSGQIVSVKKSSFYDINDIVVINRLDHFIVHRVIDILETDKTKYFLTKGDNNSFVDRWFAFKYIIGKVIDEN